jgi:acyl phosphate:glycerol-3-phosphate acyltransferase
MLELGLKFTLAYALGSVLGGLVVGWLFGGVDIRRAGSGNAGATNALRTRGKLFAFLVILIDVGKGILAVLLIPELNLPGIGFDPLVDRNLITYGVAIAAIVGHVYPIWFDFKGGKGGATAAGMLLVFAPLFAPVIIGIWIGIVFATGFVGLATMSASVAAAILFAIFKPPEGEALVVFATLVAALIVFTHRSNIRRMFDGTESRFRRQADR